MSTYYFVKKSHKLSRCFALAFMLLAAWAGAGVLPAYAQSGLDYMANDISATMLTDEYQLIDVVFDEGSESETKHQFPVFVTPSEKAISMGTFFVVSDVSYNGAQIQSLKDLAQEMARVGWHSVVIPAPQLMMVMADVDAKHAAQQAKDNEQNKGEDSPEQEQATDQDSPEQKDSPDQENSPEDAETPEAEADANAAPAANANSPNIQTNLAAKAHQSQYELAYQHAFSGYLNIFLKAAIDATEQQGYQLIFAQGMSAQALLGNSHLVHSAMRTKSANEAAPIPEPIKISPDALVINNAYWPERTINNTIAMRAAKTPMPLLDLVSPHDNMWSRATEDKRQISARVEIKPHYRQRDIIATHQGQNSISMAREIYGWVTFLGW